MRVFDRGSGPPVIVVPGLQGRWEWARPALHRLASTCRAISYSLSGDFGSGRRLQHELGFDRRRIQRQHMLHEPLTPALHAIGGLGRHQLAPAGAQVQQRERGRRQRHRVARRATTPYQPFLQPGTYHPFLQHRRQQQQAYQRGGIGCGDLAGTDQVRRQQGNGRHDRHRATRTAPVAGATAEIVRLIPNKQERFSPPGKKFVQAREWRPAGVKTAGLPYPPHRLMRGNGSGSNRYRG